MPTDLFAVFFGGAAGEVVPGEHGRLDLGKLAEVDGCCVRYLAAAAWKAPFHCTNLSIAAKPIRPARLLFRSKAVSASLNVKCSIASWSPKSSATVVSCLSTRIIVSPGLWARRTGA